MLLPESPKYLLSRGKYDKALEIFRGIYATNTGKPRDTYPVKELILDEFQRQDEQQRQPKICGSTGAPIVVNKYKLMLSNIMNNSRQLFVSPILRFTMISIVINFTFHIGYYGMMMWFPELFNRFDEFHREYPDRAASVCEVTDYVVHRGSQSVESFCSDKISGSVFFESLITVASAIPANIVAVLGMDRLGRKFFLREFLFFILIMTL